MVRKFPPFRSERKKRSTSEGTPQFPDGISGKLLYHLTSNRNFRIFWPNGKHPKKFWLNGSCSKKFSNVSPRSLRTQTYFRLSLGSAGKLVKPVFVSPRSNVPKVYIIRTASGPGIKFAIQNGRPELIRSSLPSAVAILFNIDRRGSLKRSNL